MGREGPHRGVVLNLEAGGEVVAELRDAAPGPLRRRETPEGGVGKLEKGGANTLSRRGGACRRDGNTNERTGGHGGPGFF